MKKNILLAVFCLILSAISFAQVPQKMSYQAVVRGSDNNLVTNHQVAMRVSILHGSADGTAVYTETHSATTNANGLLTIEIGDGTSNDDFTAINWANGPFFVMTETDVNGGDDYDIVGVSQLLSVPYAMYAQTAGNMPDVSGFLTVETDPTVPAWAKAANKPTYTYEEIENTPDLFDGNYNSLTNKPELFSGSYEDLTNKPELFDGNYNNLTNTPDLFDGDYNSLSNRPELFSGSYEDLTNKPELFDGNYNNLTNTPDLSGYLTSYTESQTLADAAALGNSVNTQLKNVSDPTDAQDAATKAYVDELVAQLRSALAALISEPAVITSAATGITAAHVTLSGNVVCNGNATVTARGFVYGTSENDLSENVQSGSGMGIFTHTLTNLSAVTTYYYRAYATNNSGTAFGELMSFTTLATTGTLSGHDWVDLGLPSGTRWATCNVGANNPEGYGDYFAWGETTTKTTFNWSAYRYCNGSSNTLTKYCNNSNYGNNGFTDALTTLEASDDAATANWGSAWRMPTKEEFDELKNNCTVTWTTQNGVNGRLFTGPNGASIFLPAAGYRNVSGLNYAGSNGDYWSSSLDTGGPRYALYLYFYSGNCSVDYDYRYYGQSVRPVCVQ